MDHRPSQFTLRVEAQGALLYSRRTHAYTWRTPAEAFLLVAAQDMGVSEAAHVLAGRLGREAAYEAWAAVETEGALNTHGRFTGRVVESAPRLRAFGAPLVAHLGVTLACNFSCAHCYSSSGTRAPNELTLVEIQQLIEQLAAMGCMKLVLGGGEPFIRKDLPAIVAAADACGVDTYVHTNASLMKPAVLQELAACPPAGLSVSLEGPDDASNDAVRGPGTFAQALQGLAALRRHYPPGFNISVTVTPQNVTLAGELVELAHRQDAKVLLLRPAYPAGEALSHDGIMCDRDTFAAAIDNARQTAARLGVTVDAPHPYEQGVPDFDGFGCVAGKIVLGITPTGDVTPCLNLPGSFLSGNLRDRPLLDLWSAGDAFQTLREQEPNAQCDSCRHFDTCRGGCRVRALFAGSGLNGPDSWCHYEPRDGVAPVRQTGKASLLRIVANQA